ncbi:unnamed protein product, partial [Pelagomonas calceolata]
TTLAYLQSHKSPCLLAEFLPRPVPPLVQLRDLDLRGAQLRNQSIVRRRARRPRRRERVAHAVALCALRLELLLELVDLEQVRAHDVGPGVLQRLVLFFQRLDLLAVALLAARPGGVIQVALVVVVLERGGRGARGVVGHRFFFRGGGVPLQSGRACCLESSFRASAAKPIVTREPQSKNIAVVFRNLHRSATPAQSSLLFAPAP